MVVAVFMEGLPGEELNEVGCDVEVDVGVLHVCSRMVDGVPDFRGKIHTTGKEIVL